MVALTKLAGQKIHMNLHRISRTMSALLCRTDELVSLSNAVTA